MKGATAEPWANTIRTPKSATIKKIGQSQYFLRERKNVHSSLSIVIAVS
jgi:hypothetical protein